MGGSRRRKLAPTRRPMHLFCSQSYYDDRSVFVSRQAALQLQSSLHPKSLAVSTVASCGLPVRVVLASASANRVIVVLGDKIHKYVGICGDNKIKYQIKPPANVYYGGRLGLIVIRAEFNSIRTCRNVLEELKSATCLRPLRSRRWPNENQNRSKNVAIMPLDWFPLGRDR